MTANALRAGRGGRRPQTARQIVAANRPRGRGLAHVAAVNFENVILGVIDGARVLADVAGGVDSAGQFAKISTLNGLQRADSDFRDFRDLLEGNAAIAPNRG